MKKFRINYMSHEGRITYTDVEVEEYQSEDEAIAKAYEEDDGFGDGIYKIIDCEIM